MKKIKYIIILLALTDVFLSGCKKNLETEGLSKVTYYPEITMNGDATVFVSGGTAFNDPGATATANGQPITVTTPVVGDYFTYSGTTVDVTKSNRYFINYTAVNSDGFAGSVTRTVYVAYNGDLVNSIEGLYTSTVVRNGASSAQYTNMEYVMIRKTGTNTYELSDGIGGYYDLGRGYGSAYRARHATVTANNIATNDFSYGPAFGVGAFPGSATIGSMTVNPGAKTIQFTTVWDQGFTFVVTLSQVQF